MFCTLFHFIVALLLSRINVVTILANNGLGFCLVYRCRKYFHCCFGRFLFYYLAHMLSQFWQIMLAPDSTCKILLALLCTKNNATSPAPPLRRKVFRRRTNQIARPAGPPLSEAAPEVSAGERRTARSAYRAGVSSSRQDESPS